MKVQPQEQPASPGPSRGPFITAMLSTILGTGLLIALEAGMKLTLTTALSVLIPGMTFATLLIAFSMGWAFVAVGRYKQKPRWLAATAVMITITMMELLVLTYLANVGGKMQ